MFVWCGLSCPPMRHVLVVILLVLSVTMTGSGTVGEIKGGWSVSCDATPLAPGDTNGGVGAASVDAERTSTSVFATDNDAVLTDTTAGDWYGNVVASPVVGENVHLDIMGKLNFLVADRTVDPVWYTEGTSVITGLIGSVANGTGVGTIATPSRVAVDPFDNSFFVSSTGLIILPGFVVVEKYLVIKYDSAGNYVTQFGGTVVGGVGQGDSGSADGFFAASPSLTVAVSPVDGTVAVGDGGNSRIQFFTPNGSRTVYSYSTKAGTNGTGNSQFGGTSRIDVAYDSAGALYAGDNGNSRIQKFTISGVTVTYVTQTAISGFNPITPINDMSVGTGNQLYVALAEVAMSGVPSANGVVRRYNAALTAQRTFTIPGPIGTDSGIRRISAEGNGIWASWGQSNFIVHYNLSTPTAAEDRRWYSGYPTTPLVLSSYAMAVKTTGEVVVLFPDPAGATVDTFGQHRVLTFLWTPVTLSTAIESYMRICDPTLGGLTYSYGASANPPVVLPAWSGDVWAHLKEICTAYGIEVYLDDSTIRVADACSRFISIQNSSPIRVEPTNLLGGREVVMWATNATAGGGVVFDAAISSARFQVDVGQRKNVTVSTVNSPVAVDRVVPTDTLPILPGQYYVIDSTGAHVPAIAWSGAGAGVTTSLGDLPGQVTFSLQGPQVVISGFTGPFTFADSNAPTGKPTLTATGRGTFTDPQSITLQTGANPTKTTNQTARTIRNFAIDTMARLFERAPLAIDDVSGVAVTVTFSMPTADLLGFGRTIGAVFDYGDSRYRVKDAVFGSLTAKITAVRVASLDEIDTITTGLTVDQRDAIWDGYSVDDRSIKPLALSLAP